MEAQRQFAVNQAVKYIKAFYGSWAHRHSHLFALFPHPPHYLLKVTNFCFCRINSQSVFLLQIFIIRARPLVIAQDSIPHCEINKLFTMIINYI